MTRGAEARPGLHSVLNQDDSLERQNEKLKSVVAALIQRAENSDNDTTTSFAHFQTAVALEERVRSRTSELEDALAQLHQSRSRLAAAMLEAETAREDLSAALEAVREGFALFDPSGALVLSNARFARFFDDVFNKIKPGLGLDAYFDLIAHSEVLVLEANQCPKSWLDERRSRHKSTKSNFILQLKNDRWVQVSEQRMPNQGTTILQTEVTDMVRQERLERDRLLDDQALLIRATLDHIEQGICIFDAQNRVVGWNMRLLELLALPMKTIRTGSEFQLLVTFFNENRIFLLNSDGRAIEDWVQNRHKKPPLSLTAETSSGKTLSVVAQEMPDKGFVISFTDISAERDAQRLLFEVNETLEARVNSRTAQLVEARDAAEQANRSKTRFLAATSHDLLQPLNAAKLFISSLEGTGLNAAQTSITERIQSAFKSVETILRALLDISKLDGQTQVEKMAFPISHVLDPLEGEFRALAEGKGLTLNVVGNRGLVVSDPAYLRRIIQNLVSNAVAYTDQGKILIGARRRGAFLQVDIFDTGVGIEEEQQEHIFEEFHRVNQAAQGMGLGLAIVRRACNLLDHTLSMQSTVGKGTRFSLLVPLVDYAVNDAHFKPDDDLVQGSNDLSNVLVLIIENEADVRDGMETLIDSWGASPIAVSNYTEAENAIRELGIVPDIVLADYHLDDGVTGASVIKRLREKHGSIVAVLITANYSAELAEEAKANNISLYHKPLQADALKALMTRLSL